MTTFEFFKAQLDKSIAEGKMPYPISFPDIRIPRDASWGGAWGSEAKNISDLQEMIEKGLIKHFHLAEKQSEDTLETELYLLSSEGRILFYEHFYGVI